MHRLESRLISSDWKKSDCSFNTETPSDWSPAWETAEVFYLIYYLCERLRAEDERMTSLFSCFVLFKGEICALQFLVRLLSSCRNEFHWSECWSFTIKAGGILSGTSMFKLVQHPRDYFQQRSNPLSLETPLSPCWKEATSSLHFLCLLLIMFLMSLKCMAGNVLPNMMFVCSFVKMSRCLKLCFVMSWTEE